MKSNFNFHLSYYVATSSINPQPTFVYYMLPCPQIREQISRIIDSLDREYPELELDGRYGSLLLTRRLHLSIMNNLYMAVCKLSDNI